jgi:hypothetical protein
LDFLVRNEPFSEEINPMGLRVELSGTADPVPVPATLTLLPDPVSATASSTYPEDVLTYGPQNLYDQNPTASTLNKMIDIGAEYAGVGEGPHVVVFDYGIPVSFDGVAYAQRALGAEPDADRVPAINFWVSDTDPGPAALDLPILLDAPAATVANINMDDLRFRAYSFGQELTGQYVVFRLEAGGTFNPGGGELMLLRNLLSGDFNGDGGVDAADYVVWRKTGGTQDDYDAWRTNFGRTLAGSGSAGYSLGASAESRSAAVPEPLASAAAVLGLAGLMMFRTASARVVSRVRFW